MKRKLIKIFFVLLIFASFSAAQQKTITDLIPPVKTISGTPDTLLVSDLFYLAVYDIETIPNRDIKAQFIKGRNLLVIKSNADFEGITTLEFRNGGKIYSIPVFARKLTRITFNFKPDKKYNSVYLFGSFNNWNRADKKMEYNGEKGSYTASVTLEPGKYEYKFFADGEELLDPANKETIPNGIGGINSVLNIADPHSEKIFLHKADFKASKGNSIFTFSLETGSGRSITPANVIALLDNSRINEKYIKIEGPAVKIEIPSKETVKGKMLRAGINISGLVSNLQVIPLLKGKPDNGKESFNWYDASIYSIMIDRFNNGEKKNDAPVKHDSVDVKANYNGGDFAGITKKIKEGYFNSLGVNTLWLSPVNDNTNNAFREYPAPHRWFTGYHGYWPVSEVNVEEKFGSFEDLKELIKTAHKHNIKILLDFVSHHVHEEHPFYKAHPDWFGKLELPDGRLNLRLWDEHRLTTWFEPYMPSFDFEKSDEANEFMSKNAVWWLKATGADGYRHDAVKHVPNKFWRTLTKKIKEEIAIPGNKHVYQIGETFGSYPLVNSYVNNGQLDAQFNFEQYNTALAVFVDPSRSFRDLDNEIKKGLDVFGPLNLMGNIMDSHDKVRFMAYADGAMNNSAYDPIELGWKNPPTVKNPSSYEKAELYFAYLFTVPGLPVVYYGSEFGMTGAADPDNRRMMRFGNELNENEKKTLNTVSGIAKLRNEHPALRYGDYYPLHADKNIFSYIRSSFDERIAIVLNKSDEEQTAKLDIPSFYNAGSAISLTDKTIYKIEGGKMEIKIKPRGWLILKLK